MGSKRSSSKTLNKVPSSPTAAAPLPDENHQNPKNHNLTSPSKSRKKHKLSTPMSPNKSFLFPIPSTEGETAPQNIDQKGKVPDTSNEISLSEGTPNRSSSSRWGEADILTFLKAIASFRAKKGFLPTPSHMKDFLREIKDWPPGQLSEKNLNSKIRHLRFKFQRSTKPEQESSEFDRTFYELGLSVWGPVSLKPTGSATDPLNDDTLKENGRVEMKGNTKVKKEKASKNVCEKKDVNGDKEGEDGVEEGDMDSEDDGDSDEKAEKDMEVENGEGHEKDELLVGEDNSLLDGDAAGYPYKYLKLALEEYWTEAKLNVDTLYSALPKVDPVQAKRLDEQFLEVFEGMLKLKMEKNKVSNEIILASLSR